MHTHLHPLPFTSWCKYVLCHCVSKIGVHIHLSIAKCKTDSHQNELKTWCTYTLIVSSYKNLVVWYKKNVLLKYYLLEVDRNEDDNDTLEEDPLVSNEDEDQHDPY